MHFISKNVKVGKARVRWREIGGNMPKATIKDVAVHSGLSISTVNRALHEPGKVREETLKQVLAAAEAVGFAAVRN